jgi:4-amino-4-deoxy-L-arabinose transferase-like glycosyltransferase
MGVVVVAFAAVKLGAHLATIAATPYGVHRDEFLYLAMGDYLQFFRMDFPPFIAIAANVSRLLFGDSLLAIRILPALAGTALLVLTALIVRELGGGRSAQFIALLGMLAAPLFLRSASLFQPVVFDQLWWTLALYALLRIGSTGQPRYWLLLGFAGGIGLLTKFSIGFIAVGVLVALLVTRERRWLATRWPYVSAAIALLVGSASVIGQIRLRFPVLAQMGDLQRAQLERVTPAAFLEGQFMMLGPAAFLLAVTGAVFLLAHHRAAPWRAVGVACVTAFLLLLLLKGKPYYAGPIYPALLAAGAVALSGPGRLRCALSVAMVVLTVAYGVVALPLGLPLLPPQRMAVYSGVIGVTSTSNTGQVLRLPQDYADMLGWEEQVAAVADAWRSLPDEQRVQAVIIASNYGEAGAIDWFGRRHGLPRAVAPIGSYWYFGPGLLPGNVAVVIGVEPAELEPFYRDVRLFRRVPNEWGVPEQQDNPILIASGSLRSLQEIWPEFKGRN